MLHLQTLIIDKYGVVIEMYENENGVFEYGTHHDRPLTQEQLVFIRYESTARTDHKGTNYYTRKEVK